MRVGVSAAAAAVAKDSIKSTVGRVRAVARAAFAENAIEVAHVTEWSGFDSTSSPFTHRSLNHRKLFILGGLRFHSFIDCHNFSLSQVNQLWSKNDVTTLYLEGKYESPLPGKTSLIDTSMNYIRKSKAGRCLRSRSPTSSKREMGSMIKDSQ